MEVEVDHVKVDSVRKVRIILSKQEYKKFLKSFMDKGATEKEANWLIAALGTQEITIVQKEGKKEEKEEERKEKYRKVEKKGMKMYRGCVDEWWKLDEDEKEKWRLKAGGKQEDGFKLFSNELLKKEDVENAGH